MTDSKRSVAFRTTLSSYVRSHGLKQAAQYSVRRISAVRRIYRLQQILTRSTKDVLTPGAPTLVTRSAVELAWDLKRSAFADGICLPAGVIERLLAESKGASESDAVIDHLDMTSSSTAETLAHDPAILEAFRLYFGYPARDVEWRMWRSRVAQVTHAERLTLGQTVDFHFDQHALNFLYLNVYLTDVAAGSGEHVLIAGSHRWKPLRFQLSSAYKTDSDIMAAYGPDAIKVVTGNAGYGFLEDAWCYHKAVAPRERERLFLQFRYR